jgi:hypothetical protein
MKYRALPIIATLFLLPCPTRAVPDKAPKKEQAKTPALSPKVRKAIHAGIKYLRNVQKADGSWEIDDFSVTRRGGWTSLTMLALLQAGVKPDDKMIQKGLGFLRMQEPTYVYVRALQTRVFVSAELKQDRQRIQANVDWLLKVRVKDDKDLLVGWTYTAARQAPDNSNSSFAIAALHAAHQAGFKVPNRVWKEIRDLYLRTQQKDGGWVYSRHHNNITYLTMSTAGLHALLIAGKGLKLKPEIRHKNGRAVLAGNDKPIKPIADALQLIGGKFFNIQPDNRVYYNLLGLSELGHQSGLRFFGNNEWYRMGSAFLLKEQDPKKGCWPGRGQHFDKWPLINTSMAILFLARPPQ